MAFPSITSLFSGGASAAQSQATAPAQQPQQQPQQQAADPNQQQQQQQQQAPADPFASFADVWKPVEQPADQLTPNNIVQFDPQQLSAAVRRMNFAGNVVSPELIQKIQAGDANALGTAFNQVAQNVMLQAMTSVSNLINGALGKHSDLMTGRMQDEMRRFQTSDTLTSKHPIFTNPAVAPLAQAMTRQFTAANPSKSPAEISQMVVDYVTSIGNALGGGAANNGTSATNQPAMDNNAPMDWTKWLGGN